MASSNQNAAKQKYFRTVSRLEAGMLLVSILFASSLFIISLNYSYPDYVLPQALSGIVITTALALLTRDHLPVKILENEADNEENEAEHEQIESQTIEKEEIYLLMLVGGYAVIGILVGLFWATPLFVFTYLSWREKSWKMRIVATVTSVFIPYLFMRYLYIDLLSGVLI